MGAALLPLMASDLSVKMLAAKMLDTSLTQSQRNDACFSLRGDASADAIEANSRGLRDPKVRSCAEENLRRAGSIGVLTTAIQDDNPDVRASAARTLGTFERPELAPIIAKAGDDSQLLVATNAIEGLSYYQDRSAVPYLLVLAKKTGIIGSLAVEQLIKLKEPKVLELARGELLNSQEPADLLAAMRVLGSMGDRSDIPTLEGLGKRFNEPVTATQGRGFGLMPAISIGRAANSSIEQIRSRP